MARQLLDAFGDLVTGTVLQKQNRFRQLQDVDFETEGVVREIDQYTIKLDPWQWAVQGYGHSVLDIYHNDELAAELLQLSHGDRVRATVRLRDASFYDDGSVIYKLTLVAITRISRDLRRIDSKPEQQR